MNIIQSLLKGCCIGVLLGLLNVGTAFAAGYKIPEQSNGAVALSGAQVANAHGPSASYNNPANMVWEADQAAVEASLSLVRLPGLRFRGTVLGVMADADSKSETVYLPNLHYISPKIGNARFGLSLVYPFGLSKRWDGLFQKAVAGEFTLTTIELDASVGYRVNEQFAIGGGVRGIYSEGIVKSDSTSLLLPARATRDLKGDDISPGYYLAATVKPIKNIVLATIYRSEVKPKLEGNAKLSSGVAGGTFDGPVSLEVTLPATLQLASALTYRKMVFEFVYERTYWSEYKTLDFEYGSSLDSSLESFNTPIEKNWKDANTYRFGFTYEHSEALTWMLGFGIDETPVPEQTLNFETPDADALIYSTGFAYHPGEHTRVTLAYLLSQKEDRQITTNDNGINGKFESSVHILNLSLVYSF